MAAPRAMLLDVEGTTSSVRFVYDTLFPYARARLASFLEARWEETRAERLALRAEHARETLPPAWRDEPDAVAAYLLWLMDRDRKSTGLKSLQGRIWEAGYREAALKGHVYPDVPAAFARWHRDGRCIAIFSSGSVLAQRLLFRHSTAGDLSPFLEAYFDTSSGSKCEAESYRRIATALDLDAASVTFVSDVVAELEAAREAGLMTVLCVRDAAAAPPDTGHVVIRSFAEL